MEPRTARSVACLITLAALIALLLAAGAAAPASARPAAGPHVDIQPFAGLAPDARSITVQVLASCPERWTVVEAIVAVLQSQASGRASFPLTCIGSLRPFVVTVPSSGGAFELSEAQVTASVVVQRGKSMRAQDSQAVQVEPTVLVELADTAQLENGGGAVVMGVTVACPDGTNGLQSSLNVSQQGQTSGGGSYLPVCDGSRHTFIVRAQATQGTYHTGSAQALTFANIEHQGNVVYGIDDGTIEIVG
jgi:hypothetical protein